LPLNAVLGGLVKGVRVAWQLLFSGPGFVGPVVHGIDHAIQSLLPRLILLLRREEAAAALLVVVDRAGKGREKDPMIILLPVERARRAMLLLGVPDETAGSS
jgi:hypothetical protein